MDTKQCKICKETKSVIDFARHVNGVSRSFCLRCLESNIPIEKKLKFNEQLNRRRERDRKSAQSNLKKTIWKSAKHRAKKQNVPFEIEIEDIVIPKYCPVLGIKLEQGKGKNIDASPSLDKIIPEKGYVKKNIKIISWRANSIKRDTTIEELQKIIQYIQNNS
jgi:hypothetical protein